MTQSRILFASYGASHINMQMPVMRALRRRGNIDVRILALTTAYSVAVAEGFDTIGFRDLLQPGDDIARAHGKRLAAGLDGGLVSVEESEAYLGLNYAELEASLGPARAAATYAENGRAAFLPIQTVGRAIDEWQPDLVVTTSAPRAERSMILAAGQRGIPALALGDMFLGFEWRWMADNAFGTRVTVLGESVRRHLIEKGRDPGSVAVVGNPAFDRLVSAETIASGQLLRERLGWQDNSVIAWTLPAVNPGDTRIAPIPDKLAILKSMLDRDPDLRLILRCHPNQKIDFGPLDHRFHVSPRQESVHAVIHAVDVLFTEFSMVGMEAALAGKPVVTNSTDDAIPYGSLGLTQNIDTIAELDETLIRVLRDRPTPRLDLLGAPPTGTATDNVLGEIDLLLSSRRKSS
ncbi:MAG: hypothetical protein P1U37_04160 [Minwuia sp.]|nr:hypothetical protein [Minwuia sp.]